ncbi:unnamed protein product [Sphenostylis stenocarpa]|uniref:Inositol-tetrakisphosphate 1-kinase n=1 Tax=Sphenostylis stenocarpa TaxID=92480 RepID=A0AA86VDN5_9FABA|nr:unnamed protein product [Sphenostylis stenocarpa]
MAEDKRFRVGYALLPKKQNSFIRDSFVNLARSRGIDLVRIEPNRNLMEQGPFDCVLHKLSGDDWRNQLSEFTKNYPNAVILDSPEFIERLHNRISMLQAVPELKIDDRVETVGIPNQIVIYDKETLFEGQICKALKSPVIAKPLVADGSAKSHKMALVYNHQGLNSLKPPLVVQEFVNHGGVIFKVYVVGERVTCVKRKSLPDVGEEELMRVSQDLWAFSQVSNLGSNERTDEKYYKKMHLDDAEMPPPDFLTEIAGELRRVMKLSLFNFDVIRDSERKNLYLIVDINYFPGYAKMPGYETVWTDFLCDVLCKKQQGSKECSQNGGFHGCDKDARKIARNAYCGDADNGGIQI